MQNSFLNVTEIPGQKATKDQFSIMRTRYELAVEHANSDSDVLEIACGSGIGLGYIANKAKRVVGGDIDEKLLSYGKDTYKEDNSVDVIYLDAHELPFKDASFDLILIYEAIYYFKDLNKVFDEVRRVLRPNGKLIISTVNKEWHGFNPSPFSIRYYTVTELKKIYESKSMSSEVRLGFKDEIKDKNALVSIIRRIAVKLHLIPKTMEGKEKLKRLFYGKLETIPKILQPNTGLLEPLVSYTTELDTLNYKQIYLIGTLKK